jgi:DNA repair ATPase RecN
MYSQAFSDGKSPVEVAIELNIRAPEAIILQREYWDLVGLYDLNQLYEGIKSNILYIANLWNAVKASGMQIPHVLPVLNTSNNHLPNVEQRYSLLKQEVESLQERKRDLSNQVTIQSNELEYYLARCQQEKATFNTLLERRNNAEDLVRHFENNNQEYVKIRRTVEEKVNAILSNAKPFIQLALYCLIESMKVTTPQITSVTLMIAPHILILRLS